MVQTVSAWKVLIFHTKPRKAYKTKADTQQIQTENKIPRPLAVPLVLRHLAVCGVALLLLRQCLQPSRYRTLPAGAPAATAGLWGISADSAFCPKSEEIRPWVQTGHRLSPRSLFSFGFLYRLWPRARLSA